MRPGANVELYLDARSKTYIRDTLIYRAELAIKFDAIKLVSLLMI